MPEPARAELRTHARREARLRAIRRRAQEANDAETVARVDEVLQRESRRHDGELTAIAARARGDEQPNENAEEGQATAAAAQADDAEGEEEAADEDSSADSDEGTME